MITIAKKDGFWNGIILGILLIALTSYIYFVDLQLLNNVWFGTFKIFLTILLGIFSVVYTKRKLGGLISFKESFSSYFLTIFVGSLFLCIFMIILFSFVFSTAKIELIKDVQSEFNLYIMKLNYATAAQMEEAKKLSEALNPADTIEIIGLSVRYLLRDCLFGLFVALIFRNKRTL